MATSRTQTRIFVSHSHKDNDFGMRLIADLRAALGDDAAVWYDASGGLHGGDAWWRNIVAQVSVRSVFLVILSPDAMASPWVNDEIDLAWKQKNAPEGKLILPVLYRACQVREDLQTRQIVSFLPPKPYETALAELFAALGVSVSAAPTYKHPAQQAQQTLPTAGEVQSNPAAQPAPAPPSPTPAFPYLPPAARPRSNPAPEAVAQTSGRQTAPSGSPDGTPAPLPFPQVSPDGTPAPLPGIRLRAGGGRRRAQGAQGAKNDTETPNLALDQQEQRRGAAASATAPAGPAGPDGAPARLGGAPLPRRTFLRGAGVATGAGLAALAGAGLLAYASHNGHSSGPFSSSTRRSTPSPTPVPTVSTPRWHFSLPSGTTISGSPLVANGMLYIGADSSDGTLYALDAGSGEKKWAVKLANPIASALGQPVSSVNANIASTPIVAAQNVLCVSANGFLVGVDTGSGQALWETRYFYPLTNGMEDAQPVVSNGAIYLLYMFGLLKYDAGTGARLPTDDIVYPPDTVYYTPTSNTYLPAISGDHIYGITSFSPDAQVQQYKLTGGNPTWAYHISGNLTSPIAANGTIYVGASDGNLYALRPPATTALWIYSARASNGLAPPIGQPPAVADGIVYAAAGSTLHAIDATNGKAKWQMPIGALALSTPVVADGVVYVGADKYVYAFDAAKGTPLRRFQVSGTASSIPVVANKTLYAATYEGTVCAFSLT